MSRRTSISSTTSTQSTFNTQRSSTTRRSSIPDALFTESINVIVRCRGRGQTANEKNSPNVVSVPSDGTPQIKLLIPEEVQAHSIDLTGTNIIDSTRKYKLDQVYGPSTDQLTFFQKAAEGICDEFLKGYNCTIFAYGQTGAGKTYTMCGEVSSETLTPESGIIPRCLKKLFDTESCQDIVLKCSFVEIYNEVLNDLLSDGENDNKLTIYEENKNIKIKHLEEFYIRDFKDAMRLLHIGMERRKTASTKMNKLSSRSHSIFTIHLMKKAPGGAEYRFAKMNLVDLAGSENVNRSGSRNQRAKEAGSINQSLLTLGRVINCLVDDSSFIPYRESKLTRLLQDSLGGKTKTILVANIAPTLADLQSTVSTLDYASKAKNIKNTAQIGPLVAEDYILNDLIEANRRLKLDLMATRKRENCIVMDDANYNELHLSQKALKDEVEELRGLKVSLLNQLNCQMKTIDSHKSEKTLLDETIQKLEQKLVDFENKFRKQKQEEETLKNKWTQLYKSFTDELNVLYQSQINTRSLLSDQILRSLVSITSKLNSIDTDDKTLAAAFEKIKNELSEALDKVDELIKEEETAVSHLNQSHLKMHEISEELVSNRNSMVKSIDKLSYVTESQTSMNRKFHSFLQEFLKNEDSQFLNFVHKETRGKLTEFQKEMSQKMDELMNESIENHYRLFLKHYKQKLSTDEDSWNKATEGFASESFRSKNTIKEMIGLQEKKMSSITQQTIASIGNGQKSLVSLKEGLDSVKSSTSFLTNKVLSTQKIQGERSEQMSLTFGDVKDHMGDLKDTVKDILSKDNIDLLAQGEQIKTAMKDITGGEKENNNHNENVNVLKSSTNLIRPSSNSSSTKSSPLQSTIRLSASKSPLRDSIELQSPTRSPVRSRYGSRFGSPPKSAYRSPGKAKYGNNLAFGMKRESSIDSPRDAKRKHT